MRVEISKIYKDSYIKLIKEINSFAKKFTVKEYSKAKDYEKLLLNKNLSFNKKKTELIKNLHKLTVKTFSIDIDKIKSTKNVLTNLKHNISVLRDIINKLKDINHYLEESFLAELGLIKKSLKVYNSKNPQELIEKARFTLNKKYLEKLEHTTYNLIEKIIIFDKKLLKGFKLKEEKVFNKQKTSIKDVKGILKTQTELLHHLEAKLPPPSKIKAALLKKDLFSQWTSRIFALLTAIESEHKKEQLIFKKLKKNIKLSKIINKKIKSLEKEKFNLIKIKQKRVENTTKSTNELRLMLQDYTAIKRM